MRKNKIPRQEPVSPVTNTVDSPAAQRVTKAGFVIWVAMTIVVAMYSVNAAVVFAVISLVLFFWHTAKMCARTRAANARPTAAGQAA